MEWRSKIGILLVPIALLAAWFLLSRVWYPSIMAESFVHEGNLIQDNPGFEPEIWHLVYEEQGKPGLSVPLVFDHDSRCGPEGMRTTCNISFEQGERVRIEGVKKGSVVRVRTLTYLQLEEGMHVKLYFYSPERDIDASGNIMCSRAGLEPVERVITKTQTPLMESIKLLLRGEISAEERAQGITSEFPLSGVELEKAVIEDGIATLTLNDTQNKTSGGSCRVAILWAQIEATAKQFPTVTSVRFEPEELFQP